MPFRLFHRHCFQYRKIQTGCKSPPSLRMWWCSRRRQCSPVEEKYPDPIIVKNNVSPLPPYGKLFFHFLSLLPFRKSKRYSWFYVMAALHQLCLLLVHLGPPVPCVPCSWHKWQLAMEMISVDCKWRQIPSCCSVWQSQLNTTRCSEEENLDQLTFR